MNQKIEIPWTIGPALTLITVLTILMSLFMIGFGIWTYPKTDFRIHLLFFGLAGVNFFQILGKVYCTEFGITYFGYLILTFKTMAWNEMKRVEMLRGSQYSYFRIEIYDQTEKKKMSIVRNFFSKKDVRKFIALIEEKVPGVELDSETRSFKKTNPFMGERNV